MRGIRPPCIRAGHHDAATESVIIQFHDGSIYRYSTLTAEEWANWRDAPSRGCFFNNTIRRPPYRYVRLNEWPENTLPEIIDDRSAVDEAWRHCG